MTPKRGYRTIRLDLPRSKTKVAIYTSPRVADALVEITRDATLYEGVRLSQVIEAAYLQGTKDGALAAFERMDRSLAAAKTEVPHRRPGRPPKTKRSARRG